MPGTADQTAACNVAVIVSGVLVGNVTTLI